MFSIWNLKPFKIKHVQDTVSNFLMCGTCNISYQFHWKLPNLIAKVNVPIECKLIFAEQLIRCEV